MRKLIVAFAIVASSLSGTPAEAAPQRPNIILIVTDDQRWDTVTPEFMPVVTSRLQTQGVTYTNSFVSNALCCPSRASTLTGTYSHTTGVYGNKPPFGGFASFEDRRTMATALTPEYRTLFVGKYLNGYPERDWEYVPPGWDRWFSVRGGSFYNYYAADNGHRSGFHDADPADYSARVLTDEAVKYVRHTDPATPYFLFFAPVAPHASTNSVPSQRGLPIPDPRDRDRFAGIEPWRPASYGNRDSVEDMPHYIREQGWNRTLRAKTDRFRRRQLESIYSNDREIGRLLDAAETRDPGLQNTVVIFTSDNGILWGEHRWHLKVVPYEESIRVPLIIRYPGGAPVGSDRRIAINVDLVPTLLEVAGYDPTTTVTGTDDYRSDGQPIPPEGESLLGGAPRRATVLEHWGYNPTAPGYCGVRTIEGFMYVRYWDAPRLTYNGEDNGFQELYDVNADPLEQTNLAGDPDYDAEQAALRAETRDLCRPVPPRYSWG